MKHRSASSTAPDAVASDKVKVVGVFPEDSHKPVEYPMAIVKDRQNPTVSAFYTYLKARKRPLFLNIMDSPRVNDSE